MAQEKRAAARAARQAKVAAPTVTEAEIEDIAEMAVTEEGIDPPPEPEEALEVPDATPFGLYVAALPEEVRSELSLDELREAFEFGRARSEVRTPQAIAGGRTGESQGPRSGQ